MNQTVGGTLNEIISTEEAVELPYSIHLCASKCSERCKDIEKAWLDFLVTIYCFNHPLSLVIHEFYEFALYALNRLPPF